MCGRNEKSAAEDQGYGRKIMKKFLMDKKGHIR